MKTAITPIFTHDMLAQGRAQQMLSRTEHVSLGDFSSTDAALSMLSGGLRPQSRMNVVLLGDMPNYRGQLGAKALHGYMQSHKQLSRIPIIGIAERPLRDYGIEIPSELDLTMNGLWHLRDALGALPEPTHLARLSLINAEQ